MSGFADYLHDVFRNFGGISCRPMFGGYGVYHKGLMFGLVAEDTLYFKADESCTDLFQHRGLEPFEYPRAGKMITMSYYRAPEEIYDNPHDAKLWAERAYDCAFRAKKKKK